MKKSRKKLLICTTLVILAGTGFGVWKYTYAQKAGKPAATAAASGKNAVPAGPLPVVVEKVAHEDIMISISAVGSLVPGEATDIHSEIAGRIDKIYFEEGQPIKKGEILLQIDKSLIETELQKATAALNVSSSVFSRDDNLKKRGFASTQKWDLSKSEVDTAKAAVDNARIRLEKTTIRAPFSGIVGLRNFSVGDYTEVGQALTSLVSIDPLKLEFSVPEKNYTDIKPGQAISLTVDAWPGKTFKGEIYAVDPRIDMQTRNFKVKATIPNDAKALRPGMYARITVETASKSSVIMIPEEAIIPQGDDSFVMVIQNGRATRKQVSTGLRQQGEVEITKGLEEGDTVITAGLQRLREGSEVKPIEQQNTAPAEVQQDKDAPETTTPENAADNVRNQKKDAE